MQDRTRAHLYITGTVQGVFFRARTRDEAIKHGVDGWVRNLSDGRVEAVLEGPQTAVESVVEWCHTGSERATVTDVDIEYEQPTDVKGFEIKR